MFPEHFKVVRLAVPVPGHHALLRRCPPGTWRWHHTPPCPPHPVHLAARGSRGRHSGSRLSAPSPSLPAQWRAPGEAAHMLRADLKGTQLGHVPSANLASWIKSEEAGKVVWIIEMHVLACVCVCVEPRLLQGVTHCSFACFSISDWAAAAVHVRDCAAPECFCWTLLCFVKRQNKLVGVTATTLCSTAWIKKKRAKGPIL